MAKFDISNPMIVKETFPFVIYHAFCDDTLNLSSTRWCGNDTLMKRNLSNKMNDFFGTIINTNLK